MPAPKVTLPANQFDPAAAAYDAARAFPPGVGAIVAAGALALVPGAVRWLEVGVGTGRIAQPLARLGAAVAGVDLSAGMLAHLRAAWPEGLAPLPLAQGDVVALPVATGACDVVVAVHVLQLLANWRAALAEMRRVLAPAGALLLGYEWRPPASPGARLRDQWNAILVAHGGLPGTGGGQADFGDMAAALQASGAALTEQAVGEWTLTRTLARQIETIEHRTWSHSWDVPSDFFPRCLAELRAWAAAAFGSLEAAYPVLHRFVWQRFTWPARP
ncbi:MAG: class I SAM-dependent methyltransferase [Anaerolineales bacterium]|nr:class I SAM-dependent methyltransferase [Anaerolineales bacterium]